MTDLKQSVDTHQSIKINSAEDPWYMNPGVLFKGKIQFIPTTFMSINTQRIALARSIILITFIRSVLLQSFEPVLHGCVLLLSTLIFSLDHHNPFITNTDANTHDPLVGSNSEDVTLDQHTLERLQQPVNESPSKHPPRPSVTSQIYSTRAPQHTDSIHDFGVPVGMAKTLSHRR